MIGGKASRVDESLDSLGSDDAEDSLRDDLDSAGFENTNSSPKLGHRVNGDDGAEKESNISSDSHGFNLRRTRIPLWI